MSVGRNLTSLNDQQRYQVFIRPSYVFIGFHVSVGNHCRRIRLKKKTGYSRTCFPHASSSPPHAASLLSLYLCPPLLFSLSHTHSLGLPRSHPLICTWEPRWWHPRAPDEAWRCVPMCSHSLSHPSHTECSRTSAHDQMSRKDIKTWLFCAPRCSPEFKGDSAKICIYSSALFLPFLLCLFACF